MNEINNKLRSVISITTVLILLSLSGCWDSKDIQQKDIHITQLIDYKDGNYILYGEVADLSAKQQKGDSGNNKAQNFNIIMAEGESLNLARDELNRKSSMPIYLGAGRVLLFTERFAASGLEEYLNRSRTQHDARKSIKIVTTPVEPEELLNAKPDNSASVGLAIDKMMESLVDEGTSFDLNIGSLLEALAVKKTGFLIPDVGLKGSDIMFAGYSVFKDTKEVGFIPADKSRGIVFFLNPGARFSYEVRNGSGKFHLETALAGKKIRTFYQGGHLGITVAMNFKAELNYADKVQPVSDSDRNQLQEILAGMIRQDILSALKVSQKQYRSDYLGIYRYFRINYNSDFKTVDWEKIYGDAKVEVTAKVLIVNSELPQK